jgi:hypothetical protein
VPRGIPPLPEEWDENEEIDANEPISDLDLCPAEEEQAPEPEPVLACYRREWPPDCVATHEDPDVSLLYYHMQNPEIANYVNPFATVSALL